MTYPYIFLNLAIFISTVVRLAALRKKNLIILDMGLLAIMYVISTSIAGFRFQTGGDWAVYQEWYEAFTFEGMFKDGVEFGWICYSLFIKYIGLNFNEYTLITAVISNGLIFFGIYRLSNQRWMAIVACGFYCLIAFYSTQMFYIRSGMAIGFFIISISFWRNNKLFALIALFIGISIHYATILAIFIYYVIRFGVQKPIRLFILLPLLYAILNLIISKYAPEGYSSGVFSSARDLNIKSIIGILLLSYIFLKIKIMTKSFGVDLTAISIACFLAPFLFDSYEVGSRVRLFFSPLDGYSLIIVFYTMVGNKWIFLPLIASEIAFTYLYWSNNYVLDLFTPYKAWISFL